MAEVDPGVPETDACEGGRQVHLAPDHGPLKHLSWRGEPGLHVLAIID